MKRVVKRTVRDAKKKANKEFLQIVNHEERSESEKFKERGVDSGKSEGEAMGGMRE